MQDLLRLAVENHEASTGTPPDLQPMDPGRQEWLNEALSNLQADPVLEMKKGIEIIGRAIEAANATGMSPEVEDGLATTLDTLTDYVGSIDYANDFNKLNGMAFFAPLLGMDSVQIKTKACELFAEIVQNNPTAQALALENGLHGVLTLRLDTDSNTTVRVKALYALSCLIRDNASGQEKFNSEVDGPSILLRAIQTETQDHKLRIKAAFLLTSLCQSQPSFKDTLFKMGFVEQLVALLHTEHNDSHEFLLSALYAIVCDSPDAIKETHRPELRLAELLRSKLNVLKELPEFSEERFFTTNLLQICFPNSDRDQEEER
jgi:hsp70-interacting protein